jgi:hypothetical protein
MWLILNKMTKKLLITDDYVLIVEVWEVIADVAMPRVVCECLLFYS